MRDESIAVVLRWSMTGRTGAITGADIDLTARPRPLRVTRAIPKWVDIGIVNAPGAVVLVWAIALDTTAITVPDITIAGVPSIPGITAAVPVLIPARVFDAVLTLVHVRTTAPSIRAADRMALPEVLHTASPAPVLVTVAKPVHV
jgi:hypothetical protein